MKKSSETKSRYSFGEAVADLARNFATAPFVPSDSAEFMRLCIEWAENFEARNKGRQWDGEFIEEIDRYFHAEFEAWRASASDCNANPSCNAPAVQTHAANPADNAPAQHTPGPWHTNVDCGVLSESGLHICDVNGYGATSETKRANAELIASAPRLKREHDELLAMLKRVQEIFECGEDLSKVNFFGTEQNQIRALIARIEKGGAS